MGWKRIFLEPATPRQRQYEALRAIAVDNSSIATVAKKFGYTKASLYSMIRDCKAGKLELFPQIARGPKQRQTPLSIRQRVLDHRRENLSSADIQSRLQEEGFTCSVRTVERILADANIPRLSRRSFAQLGKTSKNAIISERTAAIDFTTLKPFRYDCPVVGVFFFLPYLIESGIIDILKACKLPKSSVIHSQQACLSMLLLKLIGAERLSHMNDYDHEPGLGIFAGLNFLPKATFMATYSCRTSEEMLAQFQQQLMTIFQKKYPAFYQSNFINLDFHSIPHYGEESQMERLWVGAKHQVMKGANTLFAQDSQSNAILYTRADILRKNETKEIQHFVHYWKTIKHRDVTETLVFDCKLTSYQVLDDLNREGIKFITLRKRSKNLITMTNQIEEKHWKHLHVPIPKRKNKTCKVYESQVILKKRFLPVRQIIIKDHGRAEPTYIITNHLDLKIDQILIIYAKRWRIENKLAELASFFNLNALSSPLMIRIHFDILWTMIADTLYHRFAQDLPRFEHERADSLFRHFVNMPGQVVYDGKEFIIKIRKRAHTPILLGVKRLQQPVSIPWLGHRMLRIEWTA
jgi:transposase